MKFFTKITVTGDLILIKTNVPTPPPFPVIAQSVPRADAWLIRLFLWFISFFAPIIACWPPQISPDIQARLAVLGIVALAVVEVLAQAHIEKVLGAIA